MAATENAAAAQGNSAFRSNAAGLEAIWFAVGHTETTEINSPFRFHPAAPEAIWFAVGHTETTEINSPFRFHSAALEAIWLAGGRGQTAPGGSNLLPLEIGSRHFLPAAD